MSTGVYSYTLWHFVGFFVCNSVVLCVIHNSVGSALLVLTVMGIPEPRSVERVTVQFLRFFILLHIAIKGLVAAKTLYNETSTKKSILNECDAGFIGICQLCTGDCAGNQF